MTRIDDLSDSCKKCVAFSSMVSRVPVCSPMEIEVISACGKYGQSIVLNASSSESPCSTCLQSSAALVCKIELFKTVCAYSSESLSGTPERTSNPSVCTNNDKSKSNAIFPISGSVRIILSCAYFMIGRCNAVFKSTREIMKLTKKIITVVVVQYVLSARTNFVDVGKSCCMFAKNGSN